MCYFQVRVLKNQSHDQKVVAFFSSGPQAFGTRGPAPGGTAFEPGYPKNMRNSDDTNHPVQSANHPAQSTNHPARPISNTDHLVPHANRLLALAGRAAWKGIRLLAGIAIRIPRWFVRANRRSPKHIDPNR